MIRAESGCAGAGASGGCAGEGGGEHAGCHVYVGITSEPSLCEPRSGHWENCDMQWSTEHSASEPAKKVSVTVFGQVCVGPPSALLKQHSHAQSSAPHGGGGGGGLHRALGVYVASFV